MKQFFFAVLVMFSFSLVAQNNVEKAPVPVPVDVKAERAKAVTEVVAATPAQPEEVPSKAKMEFESMTVDYGKIEWDSEPLRILKFTNTGTEPLIIKNAKGSCGCTIPTWPKEPIAPGATSTIEVRYDTKRTGRISKSITITTNEVDNTHHIQVVGEIGPKPEDLTVPKPEPTIIKG